MRGEEGGLAGVILPAAGLERAVAALLSDGRAEATLPVVGLGTTVGATAAPAGAEAKAIQAKQPKAVCTLEPSGPQGSPNLLLCPPRFPRPIFRLCVPKSNPSSKAKFTDRIRLFYLSFSVFVAGRALTLPDPPPERHQPRSWTLTKTRLTCYRANTVDRLRYFYGINVKIDPKKGTGTRKKREDKREKNGDPTGN